MIGRGLGIALLVSLTIHIFGMSAVTIITPEDLRRSGPYTRVDFLGPILKKTAFDIMLENAEPLMSTTYQYSPLDAHDSYLDVVITKRKPAVPEFPDRLESDMDAFVIGYLTGAKTVPGIKLDFAGKSPVFRGWSGMDKASPRTRAVVYKPEAPLIMRSRYGDETSFKVRLKVLIGKDGDVKRVEPLTTTGYPDLDMTASKFVKGWIFEPRKGIAEEDEWQEVEIILNAGRE
jgi:hypothetical protein